jgi:YfiH family protein
MMLLQLQQWLEQFPWLSAGMSTRSGGVSRASWQGFNMALHVGDELKHVIENRRRLLDALGFEFGMWTSAQQVHGCEVIEVHPSAVGAGRLKQDDAIAGKDAMITSQQGVVLAAFFADCVPLWFVDPKHKAIGIAHAGWRGSVKNIATAAVNAMSSAFGSLPTDIRIAIGPSIRGCCYEVDEPVIEQIEKAGGRRGSIYNPSTILGKYWLDLANFNRQILIEAGILPNHIELTGYCTACQPNMFFSFRKEQGLTGRMAAWIAIREEVANTR